MPVSATHVSSKLSDQSDRYAWLLVLLLITPLLNAAEADDPAWRSFQHALGEPALIGVNADHPLATTPYRPVPAPEPADIDPLRYQLGFRLFHEGRLSSGNAIGCISCHTGVLSGADQRQVSTGVEGARGTHNALSVFNAAFNFRQFWDGRAVTLEDQALEPIQNPVEMANTLEAAEDMLQTDDRYPAVFESVYPDGVTYQNMADALAHFQRINFRRLESPFQRYLNGEEDALSPQARRGKQRFEEVGCVNCHNGINLGGNSYQALDTILPYYDGENRVADKHDAGVMDRTGREQDRYVWRVPGLHGVANTAPYFHDGTVATLEEAIEIMLQYQHGLRPEPEMVADIEAFLRSLSVSFTPYREVDDAQEDNDTATDTVDHATRYKESITALRATIPELHAAMQAIYDNNVAHFDFVQFQHRELIRHARALHYPPSSLPGDKSKQLVSHATSLLTEINDMEWIIADFLRAQATMGVLDALKNRPEQNRHPEAPGSQRIGETLKTQRSLAREAISDILALDLTDHLETIRQVFELSVADP